MIGHASTEESRREDAEYDEAHYKCLICLDQSWLPSLFCDGFGEGIGKVLRRDLLPIQWCGDGKHHQGHSYTPGRCDCWRRAQIGRPEPVAQAKQRAR